MGIIAFLIFGLVVGLLGRALMPGKQSMGIIMTTVLGAGGSLLGGFIGSMLSNNEPTRIHAAGLIGSVIGALILLAIGGGVGRRTQHG